MARYERLGRFRRRWLKRGAQLAELARLKHAGLDGKEPVNERGAVFAEIGAADEIKFTRLIVDFDNRAGCRRAEIEAHELGVGNHFFCAVSVHITQLVRHPADHRIGIGAKEGVGLDLSSEDFCDNGLACGA